MTKLKEYFTILILITIITLPIGEYTILDEGTFSKAQISIIYCGIINDNTFSISCDYGRGGINLYYPINIKNIVVHDFGRSIRANIIKIKPTFLQIEVVK